jgi:transcription antitermination factor NusG
MPKQWFCATSHQGQEKLAKRELENQQFETYVPMCISEWARKPRIKAFLPGYVFVRIDLEDRSTRWRCVFSTYGVRSVICSGDRPQPVYDYIIDEIKAREQGGLVQLPPRVRCKFQHGETVRVKGNPIDAIFDEVLDHRRAAIFLSLLGRPNRVIVPLTKIAAAPAAAVA